MQKIQKEQEDDDTQFRGISNDTFLANNYLVEHLLWTKHWIRGRAHNDEQDTDLLSKKKIIV